MDELTLFAPPDGITIIENPARETGYWDVTTPSGWNVTFGRSMFHSEAEVRTFVTRMLAGRPAS